MRPLTVIAVAALVVGALLGLGELAAPTCENFAGTARHSGYPCRIDRSGGASDYHLNRARTVSVPYGDELAAGLLVVGVVRLVIVRRR